VLDLSGNAQTEVQLRLHLDAGQADAEIVGQPVQFLGDGAGAADLASEGGGQLPGQLQIFPLLQAPAHADHRLGGGNILGAPFLLLPGDDPDGVRRGRRERADRTFPAGNRRGRGRRKGPGGNCRHDGPSHNGHPLEGRAAIGEAFHD